MKNLKNLGKTLTKAEQKEVNGGLDIYRHCTRDSECDTYEKCASNGRCLRYLPTP